MLVETLHKVDDAELWLGVGRAGDGSTLVAGLMAEKAAFVTVLLSAGEDAWIDIEDWEVLQDSP
jgi:hypothetical protein